MKILETVKGVLEALSEPYALIGGRAVALRGYPRTTFDYDFLTIDSGALRPDTWAALEASGVRADCRHGDIDDPVAGVARLSFPGGDRADVILAKWRWQRGVVERAEPEKLEGVVVPVPRTADLILLKLAAGGPIDLQDVLVLLAVGDREALVAEVGEHIAELDSDARSAWERVRSESEGS